MISIAEAQLFVAILAIVLASLAHIRLTGKLTESQLDSAVNMLYPEFNILYQDWKTDRTNHTKDTHEQKKVEK